MELAVLFKLNEFGCLLQFLWLPKAIPSIITLQKYFVVATKLLEESSGIGNTPLRFTWS